MKKEWGIDTYWNMDESRKYNAKCKRQKIVWLFSRAVSKAGKSMATESRSAVAYSREEEWGKGEWLLREKVSFWGVENIVKLDRGDCCTTPWIYFKISPNALMGEFHGIWNINVNKAVKKKRKKKCFMWLKLKLDTFLNVNTNIINNSLFCLIQAAFSKGNEFLCFAHSGN